MRRRYRSRGHLFSAIAVLASPVEAQEASLRRTGTLPLTDELALELDAWAPLVPQLLDAGVLDEAAANAVAALEVALNNVQSAGIPWTLESLASSELWAEVRRAAGLAVVDLLEQSAVYVR